MESTLIEQTHPQWHLILEKALNQVDKEYLYQLQISKNWLPGLDFLFSAFSLPLDTTRYVLLGESPYPRPDSANGYAFWDASVHALWSDTGLSKAVNRATSLRNWIKMLLVARGDLIEDVSQPAIAALNKTNLWHTANEFFSSMVNQKGFLLLNASLVYSPDKVGLHARHWRPFMQSLMAQLVLIKPDLKFIVFGRIAEKIITWINPFNGLKAEHPYNKRFITNSEVLTFFKPLDLLTKHANKK